MNKVSKTNFMEWLELNYFFKTRMWISYDEPFSVTTLVNIAYMLKEL